MNCALPLSCVGTVTEVPDTKAFVDGSFMGRVAAEAKLKAMANKAD